MRVLPTLLVAMFAATAFAGCTSADSGGFDVDGAPAKGGGKVSDTPPLFTTVELSSNTVDNSGDSVLILTMVLFDRNGENDFKRADLSLAFTGAIEESHAVEFPNSISTDEPAAFDAEGWKVWNSGAKKDGAVTAQFRYPVVRDIAIGQVTIVPTIDPDGTGIGKEPVPGTPAVFLIESFNEVTFSDALLLADGATSAATSWGDWAAEPSAQNVESANYMVVVNTGTQDDAMAVIDFSGTAFVGADSEDEIPFVLEDGSANIQFAWWEGPAGSVPQDGTFNFDSGNVESTTTVQFSDSGNVIFVKYRIVELPTILAADVYGASFTATQL